MTAEGMLQGIRSLILISLVVHPHAPTLNDIEEGQEYDQN
jgi:hypothetical protein